ncbi:hypothetical protein P3T76_013880 [Phytophthora citrophthora]|uniref:RxLR effector protein n=1 Tax=Phytophthora citrophthora TaxID=4793 RepID=A0AAD9G296_9STRA|nr:hypothetical protein P3T76_013880 [Phytophthora citrophthora]
MKSSQFILAFIVATMLESICAVGFEWEPVADVEMPDNAAVRPPNGLRRMQATTTDLSNTGSTSSSSSAASATTETEAPSTIMVLLPDNLATSYSGSGSVMFFDGSVGNEDKDESKSAGSDTIGDEGSNSASVRNFGMATMLAGWLTALLAFMML